MFHILPNTVNINIFLIKFNVSLGHIIELHITFTWETLNLIYFF